MPFEVFTKKSGRRGQPRISITKQATFQINCACLAAYLHDIQVVQLLFDPKSRRIAVKPAANEDDHVYKIARSKQGGGAISARAFLNHYQIDHAQTRAYPVAWLKDPGAVVIRLG